MSTPPHIEARRLITCWPSLFRPAEGRRVDSRALFERAKNPRTYANKDDVGRWSGGVFHGDYRSLSRFDRGEWLVLDFDLATTRRRVVEAFVGLRGMAHTTWTSTPENPRWRVAVVLSRAVTRNEHDRVWRAGASMAERGRLTP
ncbi:MAG: hypothetical protein M3O46_21470, partial [Myxococcota bacterium]|nr:hypothetical protein [Myxococcota bacterium]